MPPKSATLSIDLKSSEAGFLRSLGSQLYVPVPVQPLARPSIVWLNHRWFLQQGIDTLQPEVRASTDAWLLKSFALKSGTSGARTIYPGHLRIAQSDRYGGSGGTAHGGSGRTIAVGNFNAKGVGPTPLVPSAAEQGYTSGFMPLREAIREAIMSEIAHAELPYGAVPTICIIDTAEEFSFDSAYSEEPRAIAVRPNFVRPAHFERSIFFGTAGFEGSDQQVDALRVGRAVREAIGWEQRHRDGLFDPAKIFARLGRQIGVARAHRLWLGAFLTSNASVSGACVDFGSFRAVANWFRVYGLSYEIFGAEEEQMAGAIQSVCHYFNKYAGVSPPPYNVEEIKAAVSQSIAAGFREGCAIGLGVDEAGEEAETLSALFLEYYHAQQHRSALVDGARAYRGSWIYDQLRGSRWQGEKPPMQEGRAGAAIVHQITALQGEVGHVSAASRWLRPRPILYYNLLNARTRTAANLVREGSTRSDLIFDHVTRCLTAGRRVWRDLPRDLDVVDQHVQPHLAILGCVRRQTGEKLFWVEAFETDGRVHLHEKTVPWSEVERYFVKRTGNQLSLLFPSEAQEAAGLGVPHVYRYQDSFRLSE